MFLSLCLCSSKRYQNILVTKLNLFGDNLKSLKNNIEEKIFSLILLEVLLTITKESFVTKKNLALKSDPGYSLKIFWKKKYSLSNNIGERFQSQVSLGCEINSFW